jgi:F-type H+-transporting ATPase subunit epsilon
MIQQLSVRITSPDHVIWEGNAKSVSSKNSDGPFDILPEHANFVTVIEQNPITIRTTEKKPLIYTFGQSVIYAHDNTVNIYTTI